MENETLIQYMQIVVKWARLHTHEMMYECFAYTNISWNEAVLLIHVLIMSEWHCQQHIFYLTEPTSYNCLGPLMTFVPVDREPYHWYMLTKIMTVNLVS